MRRLPLLAVLAIAAALGACGSPCQDLGDRICGCVAEGSQRDNCKKAIENQVKNGNPRPGSNDQDFCEQKLKTCADPEKDSAMCDRLQTPAGKQDCGLAY